MGKNKKCDYFIGFNRCEEYATHQVIYASDAEMYKNGRIRNCCQKHFQDRQANGRNKGKMVIELSNQPPFNPTEYSGAVV